MQVPNIKVPSYTVYTGLARASRVMEAMTLAIRTIAILFFAVGVAVSFVVSDMQIVLNIKCEPAREVLK